MNQNIYDAFPKAPSELLKMDIELRNILLALLEGKTTSPPGRDYADLEIDKEDAKISALKIKHGVDIKTKRAFGNYSYHCMTTEQIHEFFYDRETMRKRVMKKVWLNRTLRFDKQLLHGIKWRGVNWVKNRCDVLVERINENSANDPDFEKKKGSE